MGKNKKMQQKKLKIAKKGKQIKESVQRKQKKKKGRRKRIHFSVLPQRVFSSSESTSSDSITDKSMSVAISDLTLNERMNEPACRKKHVG